MKELTQSCRPPRISEVLREHFLSLNVTQERLAEAMGVSRHSINELMNDRRSVTAGMALRLSRILGTDPEFWLNLQQACDLFEAKRSLGNEITNLTPLRKSVTEADVVRPFAELFDDAEGEDDARQQRA